MYSIGDVSLMLNIPISTLRYYDKEGLFPNLKRNGNGVRQFDDNDIEGLKMIDCLKKTGMEIKDIKIFLDWCQDGDSTLDKRKNMFLERKEKVENEIKDLEKVLDLIKFKCWYYSKAVNDGTDKIVKNMDVESMPDDIKEIYISSH